MLLFRRRRSPQASEKRKKGRAGNRAAKAKAASEEGTTAGKTPAFLYGSVYEKRSRGGQQDEKEGNWLGGGRGHNFFPLFSDKK